MAASKSVVAVAAAAAMLLSACGTGHQAVAGPSAGQYRFINATGQGTVIAASKRQPAADMLGTLIGGGQYGLADHRGKVVLINFWASWCAPCVLESPMLESVYREMSGRGVDFVGVDIKDERQAAASFIADKHMTYPMIYDEPAKTALQLGVPVGGLPVTVLIDREGRVAAVYPGAVHRPTILPVIERLAADSA